jgi:hypothetical protein
MRVGTDPLYALNRLGTKRLAAKGAWGLTSACRGKAVSPARASPLPPHSKLAPVNMCRTTRASRAPLWVPRYAQLFGPAHSARRTGFVLVSHATQIKVKNRVKTRGRKLRLAAQSRWVSPVILTGVPNCSAAPDTAQRVGCRRVPILLRLAHQGVATESRHDRGV